MTKAELISEIKSLTKKAAPCPKRESANHGKTTRETLEKHSKELHCLYEFVRLTNLYGTFSANLFRRLIGLIPPGFQFPEITSVRVLIDNEEFQSKNFRESPWTLKQEIYVCGESLGSIQVYYLEDKPLEYEGPFLREEVRLIHALSEYLGTLQEYRKTERNRKLLNDRIQEAKVEAVCKLSRGMAHDFNNLLTVINGYSRYLLDHMEDRNPIYADILEINKAGNLGAAAIKRLVGFSGKPNLNIKCLDLNKLVLDLKRSFDAMVGKDIDLVMNPSDLPATIRMDKGQLTQVLFSLAENAKEAMPKGGKLTIDVSNVILGDIFCLRHEGLQPGHFITLRVSDTGNGITPDLESRVFDPLCTTKRKRMGVGLGLASALKIVKQCGGYIDVRSQPNEGTEFFLFLPFQKEGTSSESTKPETSYKNDTGNETIVIVDSDKKFMDIIGKILSDHGYHVRTTSSARECIRFLNSKTNPIDLVLCNIITLEMSGLRLKKQLQRAQPNLQVLFIADCSTQILRQDLANGDTNVIYKPVNPSQLLHVLRQVLNKKGGGKAIKKFSQMLYFDAYTERQKTGVVVSKRESLREELIECLTSFGHLVLCSENGADALGDLKEFEGAVDYVIFDPCMDDMPYAECALEFRKINSDLQVVILIDSNAYTDIVIPEQACILALPLTRPKLKIVLDS